MVPKRKQECSNPSNEFHTSEEPKSNCSLDKKYKIKLTTEKMMQAD